MTIRTGQKIGRLEEYRRPMFPGHLCPAGLGFHCGLHGPLDLGLTPLMVVTENLFGDILTDLGAAIAGGIGLAASGNLDVSRANPSMFEPVHGSAPDIAGQQKADPTATVLSVALMLEHLGHPLAARRIEQAVADDLAARSRLGPSGTAEIGDALVTALT